MSRAAVLVLVLLASSCGDDSPTGPSNNLPACCWTQVGNGDSVFTMPDHVQTARVTGSFSGSSSNFIAWIGPAGSACGVQVALNCRLLVNELLGTLFGPTSYTGTVQTGGGGVVAVTNSSGVAWSFTEVR